LASFTVEDLARAALVRILPRSRYRLAAQTDSRFASFAADCSRIAYRQQGGTPAFLLFSGPGQDPRRAAAAAATWAEASWRPNAVQRTVHPGVVVVHVAPAAQLGAAGPVTGAAVPAAVWTVDSDTGVVNTPGRPPGSPSSSAIKQGAGALAIGMAPPTLGELDLAERSLMHVSAIGMPRVLGGVAGILLVLFALRYGLGGLFSLWTLPALFAGGFSGAKAYIAVAELASFFALVGALVGLAVFFNIANFAYRLPGFASTVPRTRNLTWAGYVGVMVALAIVIDGVVPAMERSTVAGGTDQGQYQHVTSSVADDGGEIYVLAGGDLIVDLSGWPQSEWAGVQFKTSNPSVLSLDSAPSAGGRPVARFGAHQVGAARVDAASADGRYTFQVRVNVFSG
jgi:hypothetical protein